MQPVLLIILDGFGEGKAYAGNAITSAKIPNITELKKKYPWALLKASGEAVGIPEGTQGGSEVGHFTIGAGRVVFQSLEAINRSIADRSFFKKPELLEAVERVKMAQEKGEKSALHLVGMISDQGVHSDIRHLFALLQLAKDQKIGPVFIHAITDGRDVPERSAKEFIEQIRNCIQELGFNTPGTPQASLATIIGRYYAMDRDTNWLRTQAAYELYTQGKGTKETDPVKAIENAYNRGIKTDYYIDPIILDEAGVITEKDTVIFWNFRTDRARQLTWAFTGEKDPKTGQEIGFKPEQPVHPHFVCMGPYSHKAPVVFPTPIVKNNLGEVIAKAGLTQLRIAETEKYAHVTYFFNSQVEMPLTGEDRVLIDSKKCPSYAEKPEMSAVEITDTLLTNLDKNYALIILNFANCDLVGHSGNLPASIRAVEVIDDCLGRIIPAAQKAGYTTLITGDHGNVEHKVYEENGAPCPSHTTNPVPFIVANEAELKNEGELQDVAPTILALMNLEKPKEMTGHSLIIK